MDFYTNVAKRGKYILYRGVENKKRVRRQIEYIPTLFVSSNKTNKYKTLHGKNVKPISPGNMRDCREFLDKHKETEGLTVYGNTKYEYAFISDNFNSDLLWDISTLEVVFLDIEVASENGFPEPKDATEEITAITIKHKSKYYAFGCSDYKVSQENIEYIKCSNEIDLIKKFMNLWTLIWPDIITGWNIKFFDIPYIINRTVRLMGEKEAQKLSPWNFINNKSTYIMGREQISFEISGIAILDYLELYKKFGASSARESYKLDYICHLEIGEKKVSYEEYGNIFQLYKQNFQKFMDYNIRDVNLIERLDDKLKLIELALTLAYDSKTNYEDVFKQTRMWDSLIYNHLKEKNIVIPQISKSKKNEAYEGAYVKNPIVGMHDWVASFDLTSLYPHLIMQYNLSPETLVNYENYSDELKEFIENNNINVENLLNQKVNTDILKKLKMTVTPNKQFFNIEQQGFLAKMMLDMYEDRARYKDKAISSKKELEKCEDVNKRKQLEKDIARFNNLQLSKKVCLNSAYGAIGNQHFRFFDIRIAEAVTTAGQLSIRWIENRINSYLNKILKTENFDYVIASDTDSIYLNLGPLVYKIVGRQKKIEDKRKVIRIMDLFCEEKIQPFINGAYKDLADYVNAYDQKMIMKREALGDKAIWTSKKRYIINVYNNEGVEYAKPSLKIMGLEAIKSSTPSACRDKIKEALNLIMTSDKDVLLKFIENFREEFKKLPAEDIAFPRGVNGVKSGEDGYASLDGSIYKKGAPIHVKGSLIYNNEINKRNLQKKYQRINEGDKIKFMYMKEPNPFMNMVLSFPLMLPKELDAEKYIDYDTQFEKSFIDPLKLILNSINWNIDNTNTLDEFFT